MIEKFRHSKLPYSRRCFQERRLLHERFKDRLSVNSELTPTKVSYRGNYETPGFRWMKYKEGFSKGLVEDFIASTLPNSIIDPFSGIGTTPIVAAGRGIRAVGIEIVPVGILVGKAISFAANSLDQRSFGKMGTRFLEHISSGTKSGSDFAFPHIKITEGAFPAETELAIGRAREFIGGLSDPDSRLMLNVACMSVLESVSFTRKDGQYLRWDIRSRKRIGTLMRKSSILHFW